MPDGRDPVTLRGAAYELSLLKYTTGSLRFLVLDIFSRSNPSIVSRYFEGQHRSLHRFRLGQRLSVLHRPVIGGLSPTGVLTGCSALSAWRLLHVLVPLF